MMGSNLVPETSRHWSLNGLAVAEVCLSYTTRVRLRGPAGGLMITLEGPFEIGTEGSFISVDPLKRAELAPVLAILHELAHALAVDAGGELCLTLASGIEIRCTPQSDSEAWQTQGDGCLVSASMICPPGGGTPWRY
jgi:hypothetical protein